MKTKSILAALFFLTTAPARADLFVTSFLGDSVFRYNSATGAFIDVFVAPGSGGLDGARGIALMPNSDLLVASSGSDNVLRYDGTTGAFLGAFVAAGSGGLDGPFDMSFGPDGNLYVASSIFASSEVLRYDGATGAFIDVFTGPAVPNLNTPRGIAFGQGNLFASGEGDRVWRFDDTSGAHEGSFVQDNPRGLTFGPDGNLYVGTNVSNSVFRHNGTTGAFIDTFVPFSSGGLSSPMGLVFGPDGHLYVANRGEDSIEKYDGVTGAHIGEFVTSGSGGLDDPHFFVFSPVPEPFTAALVAAGALCAVRRRRRG